MLSISYVLGQRHSEPATGSPFESGIVHEGSVHVRLSVKFYLVAMFFVVFDLEAVFIFLWAVAGRELGWKGYGEVLIFIGVLAASLAYLWRTGALDWYPAGPRVGERL
ncbi:MAG: NADH-quinone oxidoreductase subunit A [Edaphobacter sp.]